MENKSGYLIRMFSLYGYGASKTLTGILLMVGFCIFGPAIDVFAKLAGNADIPVFDRSISICSSGTISSALCFLFWLAALAEESGGRASSVARITYPDSY